MQATLMHAKQIKQNPMAPTYSGWLHPLPSASCFVVATGSPRKLFYRSWLILHLHSDLLPKLKYIFKLVERLWLRIWLCSLYCKLILVGKKWESNLPELSEMLRKVALSYNLDGFRKWEGVKVLTPQELPWKVYRKSSLTFLSPGPGLMDIG